MKRVFALLALLSFLMFAGCSTNNTPHGDFDYKPSDQYSRSDNSVVERDIKPNETVDNVSSSESNKYTTQDIENGEIYNLIQVISPQAKIVESIENSTGIKSLEIDITTNKPTLLENTREFVHQMDSIRKQGAKQLIKADYIELSFSHTIPNQKDNYLRFSFEKKGNAYYVSDDDTTELTAALRPDYAKAFMVALDDMK